MNSGLMPQSSSVLAEIASAIDAQQHSDRTHPHPRYIGLSIAEGDFLAHMSRWGSDGYPIAKTGSGRWIWREAFGVNGSPKVYRTKRDATAAVELYLEGLQARHSDARNAVSHGD